MAKPRSRRASSRVPASGADPRAPEKRVRKYNAQGKLLPQDWNGSYKYKGKFYNRRGKRISEPRFKRNVNEHTRRHPELRRYAPRKLAKRIRESDHVFVPRGLTVEDFAISTADPHKRYPFFANCIFEYPPDVVFDPTTGKIVSNLYGEPVAMNENAVEKMFRVRRSIPVGVYTVAQFKANLDRIEQGLYDEFPELVKVEGYWRAKNDVQARKR